MPRRRLGRLALQAGVSLGLLALVWVVIGGEAILARFAALRPGWLILGLALSVPQIVLSAVRWWFTTRRLGQPIRLTTAVREYYFAVFANQVLPGGVLGDGLRVWRQGRRQHRDTGAAGWGTAMRAVILERAAGQLALITCVVAALALWPEQVAVWPAGWPAPGLLLAGLLALSAALVVVAWPVMAAGDGAVATAVRRFAADARRALFSRDAAAVQAALSLAIVATYLAVFYCAGRALGIALDPLLVLTVVPLVLLSMLIPLSVAGWGVREGTAAALWAAIGLAAADGAAISLVYGLIVLAGSLPGAAFGLNR